MGPIVFAGNYIDRRGELRTQPELLEEALSRATTRFLPVWEGRCLVRGERLAMLPRAVAEPLLPNAEELIFLGEIDLGQIDNSHVFCMATTVDAAALDPVFEFVGLRDISSRLAAPEAALAAYAKAIVAWQENHRYCGLCGAANRSAEAGFVMACSAPLCGHRAFPRLDPAIIVLATRNDQCLLGRKPEWPEGRFSTIAGFVEPGESLEDALRREVHEETNILVEDCRYLGSQPWPFPAALMIGFHARATSDDIVCNDGELAEARWVSRNDIAAQRIVLPPSISIAYRLIEAWFDEGDGPTLASLDLPAPPLRIPRPLEDQQAG
jgi:NAD+ diphosphatase